MSAEAERINALIREVPDWPKPGVVFKDITPLLSDAEGFTMAVDELTKLAPQPIDIVVGMEARGFIFAAAVAYKLGAGMVPIRKKGKLPYKTIEASYDLEYGSATLQMHVDALKKGERVLLIDDLLATGGTAAATAQMIEKLGAEIVEIEFLIELAFLKGREKLTRYKVFAPISFE